MGGRADVRVRVVVIGRGTELVGVGLEHYINRSVPFTICGGWRGSVRVRVRDILGLGQGSGSGLGLGLVSLSGLGLGLGVGLGSESGTGLGLESREPDSGSCS